MSGISEGEPPCQVAPSVFVWGVSGDSPEGSIEYCVRHVVQVAFLPMLFMMVSVFWLSRVWYGFRASDALL